MAVVGEEGDGTFHFYGQPDATFACESADLRKSLEKWDMTGVYVFMYVVMNVVCKECLIMRASGFSFTPLRIYMVREVTRYFHLYVPLSVR